MKKNNTVDTAQKGQTTNKDNTLTGKIKTLKSAEARRKAREEQHRNFRINALRRRCKRMHLSDEDTEKYVEKLIEQLNAPKEYHILILCKKDDTAMIKESLAKENIKYNYCSDIHFSINGDQNVLAKIREIVPQGAKIYPYAKKMESVLAGIKPVEKEEKSSNNTTEAKKNAKIARKELNKKRAMHKKTKGKSTAKAIKRKTLLERKRQRRAKTVLMVNKKPSNVVKTAKKAA